MEHSYILAGIRFPKFCGLLFRRCGISFTPKYLLRFLFLLQNSVWSSIFNLVEKIKYGKKITATQIPSNPVIIIGHWRTGSTFLHQLLNLDSQFTTPTVFQVSVPEGFLVSAKYYKPIMDKVLAKKRPMDNVKLGFSEPQEDEYALLKMTQSSPLEELVFPKTTKYFLNSFSDFLPKKEHQNAWKKSFGGFLKRLAIQHPGKQIVLKNPFHSMRISLLREMFPEAIFIHIYRHPYAVIPSSINMWNIVGKQNTLKKRWNVPEAGDVAQVMARMHAYITRELKEIPDNRKFEMKFEELESNPQLNIETLYKHFNWPLTDDTTQKVQSFLIENRDYKKNSYTISAEVKETIKELLADFMVEYGYE
jgi:omega-hydroxy-beta-dihydromenaquinone-9 sulfotransferase